MGHHLYEENKRLKAENARLLERLQERREQDTRDEAFSLAVDAFIAFLKGEAALVTVGGETRFAMSNLKGHADVADTME